MACGQRFTTMETFVGVIAPKQPKPVVQKSPKKAPVKRTVERSAPVSREHKRRREEWFTESYGSPDLSELGINFDIDDSY